MAGSIKRAAVFLDRDGTIIEDRGDLSQPSQVVFFDETIPALRRLVGHFVLFIVTNQSGVANGTLSPEDVARVNAHVVARLSEGGVPVCAVYSCLHNRDDDCVCMKPKPYFIRRAEADFGLDLRRSFAIGDHPHDVVFADNAGATGIYVLSGHGRKHRAEVRGNVRVASGIAAAVDLVLGCDRKNPVCRN